MHSGRRRAAGLVAIGAATCGVVAVVVVWRPWRSETAAPATPRRAPTVVVRGRLTVEHGALARPRVRVVAGAGGITGDVASDGRFEVALTGRGPWTVALSAAGTARVLRVIERGPARRSLGDVALPEGRAIEGRLRDSAGRAVVGASIRARVEGEPAPWQASSLPDGTFVLASLPLAVVEITVEADGFETASRVLAAAAPAGDDVREGPASSSSAHGDGGVARQVLDWVLRRPAFLVGRATASGGEVAPDVEVSVSGPGTWPPREVRTGQDGSFRLALAPGAYDVRAARGTLVADPVYGIEVVEGAEAPVALALHEGAVLEGELVDGDGSPVPSARVVVTEGAFGALPRGLEIGADGRFRFEGLLDLPYEVSARADGYASVAGVPWAPGAGPMRLVLERAATIAGRVEDARGFPIADAVIEVVGRDGQGAPVAITRETLVSRQEVLELRARASETRLMPAGQLGVTVGPVPPIPIDVDAGIEGETDAGPGSRRRSGSRGADAGAARVPSENARVDAGTGVPALASGRDGTFVVEGLPPGRFRVIARHEGLATGQSRLVTLRPGARVDEVIVVLEEPGTVEGRVLDARGFPVEAVRVEAVGDDDLYGGTLLTERDGTFRFHPLLGATMVIARTDDGAVVRQSVEVPAAETVTVELRLPEPGQTRSGRVVDARGFPIAGAVIVELDRPRDVPDGLPGEPTGATIGVDDEHAGPIQEAPAGLATSREDGTFEIALAPGRTAVLDIDHRDHAPRRMRVDPASRDDIRVVLDPAATVRLSLESDEGRAIAGASIVARPIEPAETPDVRVEVRASSRRDGGAELTRVATGAWSVSIAAEGHAAVERRIDVTADGSYARDVELGSIVLARAGRVRGEVVDAQGEPVAGAIVAVGEVPRLVRALSVPDGVAVTDARGRFLLRGVEAGERTVRARHRVAGEGASAPLRVAPGETVDDVRVTLAAPESAEGARGDDATDGAQVAIGVEERDGRVVVSDVVPDSAAAEAGIRAGDVLVAVDGDRVVDVAGARRRLARFPRRRAELVLERDGRSFEVSVAREVVAW
ncbi:MAG: carboxypeptidase regulatory-like domain-containing protein [Deltaproteobacteria bacterium]|nr:carboxypeptidase regulatory-like domain-containing protein [Deltaproteobacteria bacterium]